MGHKISKEQIDPGVKDHIMSFVGDIADLETEVNTDIVSAVNSLMIDRIDNVENMGKLANVIGEPVTANDSVNELVDKVGELLETLKGILIDKQVEVSDEDTMADLIAKIDEGFDITKQELINALIDKGVKNIDTTLSFTEIISKIQNFDSYTEPILYLYDNGNDFTDNTGGFTFTRTSGNGGSGVANEDHLYVHVYANATASQSGSGSAYCETTNFINITNYKSLYVNLDYNYSRSGGSMGTGSFYIDLIDESGNILKTVASGTYNHVGYEGEIDITNYAGNVKIRFRTTVTAITTRSDSKLKVYHARLEKAELPTEE